MGIWVYDTIAFKPVDLLTKHNAPVKFVLITPDGKTLVSVDNRGIIHLWETYTRTHIRQIKNTRSKQSIAISPDGQTLATGDSNISINLWDMNTDEHKLKIDSYQVAKSHIFSLAFSPTVFTLASGTGPSGTGRNCNINLFDSVTGEYIKSLEGHTFIVSSLAYSPNGSKLVSGSPDNTVRFWDPETAEQINIFRPWQ